MYLTKNKSAKTAADQIFNKYILNYGFPQRIHHDMSLTITYLIGCLSLQEFQRPVSPPTPYHPMGDGQPERMNRTLINMLKCLSKTEKSNWKDHVPKLAFAYNSTLNKTSGFSPFYLMFGGSFLPIDLMFVIKVTGNRNKAGYNDYVRDWKESMKQAMEIAQKHINVCKKSNEKYYSRKRKGADNWWEVKCYLGIIRKRGDWKIAFPLGR